MDFVGTSFTRPVRVGEQEVEEVRIIDVWNNYIALLNPGKAGSIEEG